MLREIAFIDPSVPELDTLLSGLRPDIDPVVLSPKARAPEQIASALRGRAELDAIHIVAHGEPGVVSFSSGALTVENLHDHVADLAEISNALAPHGELLLWSCETGKGERGSEFVEALERAAGAKVAAASDLVGSDAKGGSWQLDAGSRAAAPPPLRPEARALYPGVLTLLDFGADPNGFINPYTENDPNTLLFGNATVDVPFLTSIEFINITIDQGYPNGSPTEQLIIPNVPNGVTVAGNGSSSILISKAALIGTLPNATWEFLLNSILYNDVTNDNQPFNFRHVVVTVGISQFPFVTVTAGTADLYIGITSVNDAPTATIVNTVYDATEQTPLNLKGTGLSTSDVDANGGTLAATLSVGAGALYAFYPPFPVGSEPSVVGISGSGTSSLTITGTLAQINAFLAAGDGSTLTYLNSSDAPPPSTTLTLTVHDNGFTGGGDLSASANALINITPVNEAPTATSTTTTYSATEQVSLNLKGTGLSIGDVDVGNNFMAATLSVGDGALFASAGNSGAVVSGSGASSLTIFGTLDQINAVLHAGGTSTLSYLNSSDAPPASTTLTLNVHDNGYTGGGGDLQASTGATINITPVNDAPTATITSTTYNATEQTSLTLKGTGLSIGDDSNVINGMTATLSVGAGALVASAGGGPAGSGEAGDLVVGGSGTSSLTISGTPSQINAFFAAGGTSTLSYLNSSDAPPASTTITLTVHDNGNTGGGDLTASANAIINITPVNDAPTATVTTTTYSATEQVSLNLKATGLSIEDVDASNNFMTVLLSVGDGALFASGGNSSALVSGSGTSDLTIFGTPAQINAVLGAGGTSFLSYLNSSDTPPASTTLTLTVHDNGNTGGGDLTASANAIINITPVNDAPLITSNGGGDTASISIAENTNTVTVATATDPDSTNLTYSIFGGADASLFTIGATTGTLAFLAAPDYERPTDVGANNVYDVTVKVSDGSLTDTQAIAVTVIDVSLEAVTGTTGSDTFRASADKEAFSGLGGSDTVSYASALAGVTASLANPGTNTGYAAGDSYNSIENLTGSAFNDKLIGDGNANVLEGGPGADKLDGGAGIDTASYAHAASGVTADLSNPANNTGEAARDTYTSIETLLGSRFNDHLVGDSANNVLNGGDGNDTLFGKDGNDQLIGGPGADTLKGGDGKDEFVQLSFNDGIDRIQDFNVKDDTLSFSAAGFGGGLVAGQHLVAGTNFIANTAPSAPLTTTTGTFLYDTDDHNLLWDADGSGAGAAVQIDHFDTAVALKADDFNIMA